MDCTGRFVCSSVRSSVRSFDRSFVGWFVRSCFRSLDSRITRHARRCTRRAHDRQHSASVHKTMMTTAMVYFVCAGNPPSSAHGSMNHLAFHVRVPRLHEGVGCLSSVAALVRACVCFVVVGGEFVGGRQVLKGETTRTTASQPTPKLPLGVHVCARVRFW